MFALGCAFSLNEIFANFNCKKLKFSCKESVDYFQDAHRDRVSARIFRDCLQMVFEDMVENSITFKLPTGSRPSCMYIRKVEGQLFKEARQNGRFADIDFIASNFAAFEPVLQMGNTMTCRIKHIYFDKALKEKLIKYTNEGRQYYETQEKTVKDYYDAIYDKYPDLCHADINRILNYGFKSLYLHNSYGADVQIDSGDFWCYFGELRRDPIKHFKYYVKKLAIKLRILHKRKHIEWDGYYYFALSQNEYDQLQIKHRGRPRKRFVFQNVALFRMFDECNLRNSGKQYIFRVKLSFDLGSYIVVRRRYETTNAELILHREPLKFKDILVSTNKYECL